KRNAWLSVGGGLGVFALLGVLGATGIITMSVTAISDVLGWCLLGISVVVFWWLIGSSEWSPEERKRSAAVRVLFVGSALFWASFEQAGSSLNLFAMRNTDRHVLRWVFPAGWFQFVQPIFVIAFAPVFAWLWLKLNRKGLEPPAPAKFSIGLLFAGLAF